ncbi:MAG: hypothetical protein K8R88_15540 [Armatimonadetes bacterium]|nr:hypothetical protein [Armatimonadota bacterium]
MLVRAKTLLLDALYPSRCGACGVIGKVGICSECVARFEPCDSMRPVAGPEPLDFVAECYRYNSCAAAVHALKYLRDTSVGYRLSELMFSVIENLRLMEDALIVPVPIHWRRQCWRGFNQSEKLCSAFPPSRVSYEALERTRHTKPQVGLSNNLRQTNLIGAFKAHRNFVEDRNILLVDDVYTSGSTARECAIALKAAGAAEVGVIAFASAR